MVMSEHEALDRDPVLKGLSVFRGVTTADGNVGGTTLVCATLIGSNDFISNDKGVLLLTGNSRFQHKGATAFNPVNGEITVSPAFGTQVLAGTYFYLLNSSTAAILGLLGAVLTRIGDPTADTLPSLTAKWGNLARSLRLLLGTRWDVAGDLGTDIGLIKTQTDKLAGAAPASGAVVANWQAAEQNLVSIGTNDTKNKLHSFVINISALVGTITVRLYMQVNNVERRVFQQNFTVAVDGPGLWIVNGTVGVHEVLRCTLQSNNAADNGQSVDYDYMLEAM